MDWSPLARRRGSLAVLLGLVLLANPFVVAEFDLGDPDRYRYEAAAVGFDADGIDVPIEVGDVDPDVACFEQTPRRRCMLELAIRENGGVTYDGLPDRILYSEYSHVYDYGEGFFEPVAVEQNGTVRYDLEPVPRAEAMAAVATDVDDVSPPIRRAIRDGPVETSDELAGADELVSDGGDYYVVYRAAARTRSGERTGFVVALQWLLGGVGLWLLLRGQRVRVAARSR